MDGRIQKMLLRSVSAGAALGLALIGVAGCASAVEAEPSEALSFAEVSDRADSDPGDETGNASTAGQGEDRSSNAAAILENLDLSEDYRAEFSHGPKGAEYQKYIVLHDTEGEGSASSVISYWDSTNNGVAAHFVVNKDGSIIQCVPMDEIAHHAGFGDTGHNAEFDVEDESRDDKVGTMPIGSWASDYGMNSYSIGIELVHVGGSGDYPIEQLEALDGLIAYIDAYYGFESVIIDHKAWRSGNSDTSAEFAAYFDNYKDHRTHD